MNRRAVVALGLSLLASACGGASGGAKTGIGGSGVTGCLSIVTWNDVHGQLQADDPHIDTGRIKAGGVVALADEVAAVRATGDATVVLDAGDLFTGPLESSLHEGAPIIDAFAAIGVDAAAVGNHEFDFGPVGYERSRAAVGVGDEAGNLGPRGALLARMAASPFPFLSANIERKDGRPLDWKNFDARTIVSRGAHRVGVVGYSTVETPITTLRPNVDDLEFAAHAAQRVASSIRALRAERAYPIVLLAHASIDGELPWRLDDALDPNGDTRSGELARLLDALGPDKPDLIAAGHRHAWMLGKLRGVPIVSSSQHGIGLTRIRYCPAGNALKLDGVERRVALAHDPPRTDLGRQTAKVVRPWLEKVRNQAETVITSLGSSCLPQGLVETAYAEQVARAIRARVADAKVPPGSTPVVALQNAGGLRAPLLAGTVKFSDLYAAFPFENAVSVCETDVAGLRRAINNASHRAFVRERFPFGIAGAHLTMKRRRDGQLDLTELKLDGATGAAKDSDNIYLVVPDFLLWGGDGYLDGVTCRAKYESNTRVRDAWRAELERERGGCDGAGASVVVE